MSRFSVPQPFSHRLLWRPPSMAVTVMDEGGHNDRNLSRAIPSCSVHWLLGFVLPICLSNSVMALSPLVVAADIARPELKGFWKEGDFVVGVPTDPGRPGLRPLKGHSPIQLPADMTGWEPIGEACQEPPHSISDFGGSPVEALVAGDRIHPKLQLWMGGRAVAEALLGHPASVCSIHIVNADHIRGPELITTWRIDASSPFRGFTVYRIPEALDPTPAASPN